MKKFYKSPYILLFLFLLLWGCASRPEHKTSLAPAESKNITMAVVSEELTVPEPDLTTAEEIRELEELGDWEEKTPELVPAQAEVSYDFPVVINKQVEFYLDFFSKKHRRTFRRWLERSGRYVPMIQYKLAEAGMPLDLAYLPMIESGYSLTAYSRARAAGPWQFIRSTGRHYGLAINSYVDERRDPEKATDAAITFLSELYERFNSWELSVAAYNAGPGKIAKGIKRYKTNDFWKIADKRFLKMETKRYVPKLIAAIIIAKNPDKYGFTNIKYDPPLEYDTVKVPRWTSLRSVTVACSVKLAELRQLNRQLRRQITPPDQASYQLKVPKGIKQNLEANLSKVHAVVTTNYKTHIVAANDTLTKICRKYKINKTTLLKVNDLRSNKLTRGQHLRIPFQTTNYVLWDKETPANEKGAHLVLHKIKPGETISIIAKQYNVPSQMIAAWNGLKNIHKIRAGQQLALYLENSTQPFVITARVHKKKHIRSDNKAAKASYTVRKGDTLWAIARRYKVKPTEIKKWNNLKTNMIHPGVELLLQQPEVTETISMLQGAEATVKN
jgi:membrane-bound lytic murein transglycosylase D